MKLKTAPHAEEAAERLSRSTQGDPAALDWAMIAAALDEHGYATVAGLIDPATCRDLAALYDDKTRFRSRVVMERYRFGKGEYKYLAYPLPEAVAALRRGLYPGLAAIANNWRRALGEGDKFPPSLDAYLETCHAAGQTRPTPLILKYGTGGYNCLHQDLYGDLVFPLQLTVLLSDPACDFTGGEFVLVEQRPRAQSRATVVPLTQGEAVIFPVHHRPVAGSRGFYRVTMRHGVSPLRRGERFTLGIIFHDAA
ncbi:MAG: 2OG-Fe(II) oxygenase [Stellaceae bacterium]